MQNYNFKHYFIGNFGKIICFLNLVFQENYFKIFYTHFYYINFYKEVNYIVNIKNDIFIDVYLSMKGEQYIYI